MSHSRGVSIIIPNYNYGRFIGEAIDSALAQTHDAVEVIVVDDGSTDDSRAVIESYGDRIRAIFQANAGQTRACSEGFAIATKPIVIFLDSDDRLVPGAAAMAACDWPSGCSKKQFCLQVLNANAELMEHRFPKYPLALEPSLVRAELLRSGYYPCPPTSGNAFARDFLTAVHPFNGHRAIDALLNALAPLNGDVVTTDRVIAHYRVHGANDSGGEALGAERFAANIADEQARVAVLEESCRCIGIAFDGKRSLRNYLPYQELKVVAAKLSDDVSSNWRSVFRHAVSALKAGIHYPQKPLHRVVRAAWIATVAVLPKRFAASLIRLRFLPTARPSIIERVLDRFRKRQIVR